MFISQEIVSKRLNCFFRSRLYSEEPSTELSEEFVQVRKKGGKGYSIRIAVLQPSTANLTLKIYQKFVVFRGEMPVLPKLLFIANCHVYLNYLNSSSSMPLRCFTICDYSLTFQLY